MTTPSSKKNYILLIVLLAGVVLGFGLLGNRQSATTLQAIEVEGESGEVTQSGQALIGGDFALTTSKGEPYTQENLKGHYSFVFFGFSNCPDMCPTALSTITSALEAAPKDVANQFTPVFISVDPERDTAAKLNEYAANFHPSLIALTGSKDEVKQAADAFKVFFSKADVMQDKDGNYLVNHSGYIYLMGKNGEYLKHFPHTISSDDLVMALEETLQK